MTPNDFLKYVGNPLMLGAVASIVMTIIKRFWPTLEAELAFAVSTVVAVVVYLFANYVLRAFPVLPGWLTLFWPTMVFIGQQFYFWLTHETALMKKLGGKA